MTISSSVRTAGPFLGAGASAILPFNFKVFQASDLLVVKTDAALVQTTLVLSADYAVSLNGDQSNAPGGTVTTLSPIASGEQIYITTNIPILQPLRLTNAGGFFPQNIEDAFDRMTILLQQNAGEQLLRGPIGEALTPLPAAAVRKGKVLGFDATTGQPTTLVQPDAAGATALQLSLADSSSTAVGDAMVSVKRTLSNAVALSLHQWMENSFVQASDVMSQAQIADVRGGTGLMDLTAVLNSTLQSTVAVNSVARRKVLLNIEGTYKITSSLYVRAGCSLIGMGGTATKLLASGMSSIDPMVRMGYGNVGGTPASDNSGWVPVVQGIFFNGTATGIDTMGQAGWKIDDCWFSMSGRAIAAGGADGLISRCVIDTNTQTGIQITGQRITVDGAFFINPNYGIVFAAPEYTKVDDIIIRGCQFFACSYASAYAYSAAVLGSVAFQGCSFNTSYGVGVRQADQRHFYTQAGATFDIIRFHTCSFDGVAQNDIQIASGTGVVRVVGCDMSRTGIADGGASTNLQHSIVVTSAATLIVRDTDFIGVGGQSIRIATASAKGRISNCHNAGCGTGGTGLAASANEGDKAHIHFANGATGSVSDCTSDSTTLYVAGTFNTSFFHGRQNISARGDYDTHSSTAGGTYFGERNSGGTMIGSVASATALTLPFRGGECPTITVTGTTTITSIAAAGWEGRTVQLIFTGVLTLTDGSNLKLAGNFVTTGDDTITLTSDGANWYELARSVN